MHLEEIRRLGIYKNHPGFNWSVLSIIKGKQLSSKMEDYFQMKNIPLIIVVLLLFFSGCKTDTFKQTQIWNINGLNQA